MAAVIVFVFAVAALVVGVAALCKVHMISAGRQYRIWKSGDTYLPEIDKGWGWGAFRDSENCVTRYKTIEAAREVIRRYEQRQRGTPKAELIVEHSAPVVPFEWQTVSVAGEEGKDTSA